MPDWSDNTDVKYSLYYSYSEYGSIRWTSSYTANNVRPIKGIGPPRASAIKTTPKIAITHIVLSVMPLSSAYLLILRLILLVVLLLVVLSVLPI